MSRPESVMKKTYCVHGFPLLMCNSCARQSTCVHGLLQQNCLVCFMYNPPSLYGISGTTAVTQCKDVPLKAYVDGKGYVQNAKFVHKPISALEKGAITGPKAIVLHRTDSTNLESPLQSFKKGVGTHFIVDKDGTVTQTASLLKKTSHVGKIKSRCYESGTCPASEKAKIKSWGWAPQKVYDQEKVKSYPARYPMNEDSVGIEVVAKNNNGVWETATPAQLVSITKVVKILQNAYGLGEADIYEHDQISYKMPGEGADLYHGPDGGQRVQTSK
ncbi:N-acetylmuramoyl-L-alanine amidase [Archangium sp.]|uniref:peptidoglycan recognition protein family protein n=1 Tax=Archangium sp. TaxID=1872627 RepID=UPI003899E758